MKTEKMTKKLRLYAYIVIILLVALVVRLAVVQLFHNETYQTQAKDNRIRLLSIKAPRGEIYSRDEEVLAANELVYSLSLNYLGVTNQDGGDNRAVVIDNVLEILHEYYPEITREVIEEKVELQKYRLFEPVTIVRDIPWELVVEVEEKRQSLPGVDIVVEPLRCYPGGSLAGHVLGYIHSINQEELERVDSAEYSINSLIGKSGIEKSYEDELKGRDGARSVEVDASGRPIREQVTMEPVPGNNLYLTIDNDLQKVMQNSMERVLLNLQQKYPKATMGSAVLMNVKTGEILAMCSMPFMYPDDWKGNISSERAAYYLNEDGAGTNRAIQVSYPPGSTFKPITGMAVLDKGLVDPVEEPISCRGRYWIAPYIRCWSVHGSVNYYSAMAGSCNVYFQEMGRRAGNEEIVRVAREFGLGTRSGIDLPYETTGLLPTAEWKNDLNAMLVDRQYEQKRKDLEQKYDDLLANAVDEDEIAKINRQQENENAQLEAQYQIDYNWNTSWQLFDTFNMSIGEGYNDYTVIQLANYVATLANGGHRMQPYLVSRIDNHAGEVIKKTKPELVKEVDIKAETIAQTKRAMLAVTEPGGTAHFLFYQFPEEIKVGAKTGTAAARRGSSTGKNEYNGVFVAFAPYDDPEIAFAGIVEYGNSGGESAGLVAKDVFEQYFGIKDHLVEESSNTEN